MSVAEHDEGEMYRVITLNQRGTEVLVAPSGGRYRLPEVVIPRWQRVAENLTAAVKDEWGEVMICLFTPERGATERGVNGVHYQVADHWATIGPPRLRTRWLSVSALSSESFADQSDYSALERSVSEIRTRAGGGSAGPFACLGWFKELLDWIDDVIEPLGFHLNGNFRQLNASSSFSLIRFETDGPALWFKAVGEPNKKEFPITCTLARLCPGYLPTILAARPEWNGWLTREVAGKLLCETQEAALWEQAATALAKLQIVSINHGAGILATGARDLGTVALSKLIRPFMESMVQLMERQTKVLPSVLNRKELLLLGDRIQNAVDALEALEIPETPGHLDLNPGNIIVSDGRCVFLDWAEAYVGNPFFSLEYLIQHARRAFAANPEIETALRHAYCSQWDGRVSPAAMADALAFVPLVAVFAYATGCDAWRKAELLEDPTTAGYLRSLARRMHREANRLADRRPLCPQ